MTLKTVDKYTDTHTDTHVGTHCHFPSVEESQWGGTGML